MFLKTEKSNPKIREDYKKQFPRCQKCFINNDHTAIDVHHIFPARAQMKIDHFLNFLTLCRKCHMDLENLPYYDRVLAGLDLKQGA